VYQGTAYSFTPTVVGGCGTLTYSILKKTAWTSFDTKTGALTGRATPAGTYSDIEITVIDENGHSLGPFAIEVRAAQTVPTPSEWGVLVLALLITMVAVSARSLGPKSRLRIVGATFRRLP